MSTKRKRNENWDTHDKTLLNEIVAEHAVLVGKKFMDSNTKKLTWSRILNSFNAVSNIKRDIVQLQMQWRNLKKNEKLPKLANRRLSKRSSVCPSSKSLSENSFVAFPNERSLQQNNYDSDNQSIKEIDDTSSPENEVESRPSYTKETSPTGDTSSSTKNEPRLSNIKRRKDEKDSVYKKELFDLTKEVRLLEKKYLHEEHQEKMKILELEKKYNERRLELLYGDSALP